MTNRTTKQRRSSAWRTKTHYGKAKHGQNQETKRLWPRRNGRQGRDAELEMETHRAEIEKAQNVTNSHKRQEENKQKNKGRKYKNLDAYARHSRERIGSTHGPNDACRRKVRRPNRKQGETAKRFDRLPEQQQNIPLLNHHRKRSSNWGVRRGNIREQHENRRKPRDEERWQMAHPGNGLPERKGNYTKTDE